VPTQELLQEILSEIKSVKNDVSALRDDVSTLKADVSTLKVNVSDLKVDVSALKVDVSDLKVDVSALKFDISDIKATMVTKDEFMHAIAEQQDVMKLLELTDKKVDRVEFEIKNIRRDMRTIEAVTVKNWNVILDLKEAK
jgi:phage shock protein A